MSSPIGAHGPALLGGPGRAAVRGSGSGHRSGPPQPAGRLRRVRGPLAAACVAVAGVAALGLTDPYRPGGHPVCPVLVLTGFWCAGCGAQRAVHDLAHLDLAPAWGMNPLVVLAVPVAVVLWVRWLRRRLGPAPARPPEARPVTAWAALAVVVLFAVLRNVPLLQPWLAP